MTRLHVLRVFVGPDGRGGNPLGVFLDGAQISSSHRQGVARELGYSETVFVDAIADGAAEAAIFTPASELAFAGHPTLGTAWLLRETGHDIDRLSVRAGDVDAWQEDDRGWIRARAAWVHPITVAEHESPSDVDRMAGPPAGEDSYYAWAWIDEAEGLVRSRYFAPAIGIREDEATGVAAVLMGDRLRRPLTIRQGVGSELLVRPGPRGTVEVGGRVVIDDVIDYSSER